MISPVEPKVLRIIDGSPSSRAKSRRGLAAIPKSLGLTFLGFNKMLSAILVFALGACSTEPDTPEAQLRAVLERAEIAAEERDSAQLRRLVADDYVDGRGNDKKRIDALIHLYLLRNQSIHLLMRIKEIKLPAPGRAEVSVAVAMAGTPIPQDADLTDFRADFNFFDISFMDRGDGDWQVISAEWRRADLQDFL